MRTLSIALAFSCTLLLAFLGGGVSGQSSTGSGPPVNWASLDATSLAALTVDQMANAVATDLGAIPAQACTGFTSSLIAAIGSLTAQTYAWDPTHDPSTQCNGFTIGCLQNIPYQALSGLLVSCMQSFTTAQVTVLSGNQVAMIPASAWSTFKAAQIGVMTTACANITGDQTAQWHGDICSGITTTCAQLLTPNAMSGVSSCVKYLSVGVMGVLTIPQISAIRGSEFGAFTKTQLAAIPPANCAGFTYDELRAIGNEQFDACSLLTKECWAAITPTASPGVRSSCVDIAVADAFSLLSAEAFSKWDASAAYALDKRTMATLSLAACGAMQNNFLNGLNFIGSTPSKEGTCGAFRIDCLQAIPAASCSDFADEEDTPCTAGFSDAQWAAFSAAQLGQMSSTALAPIHLSALTTTCSAFKSSQVSEWDTVCAGFRTGCVQALTTEVFSGFGGGCLASIPTPAIKLLTQAQYSNIPSASFSELTYDQFNAFYTVSGQTFIDSLTLAQANAINDQTMASILTNVDSGTFATSESWTSTTDLTKKSQIQLASCSSSCITQALFASSTAPNQLPIQSWSGLRAALVSSIPAASLGSLTQTTAYQAWPDSAIFALSATQVAAIPPACFAAMNLNALNSMAVSGAVDAQWNFCSVSTIAELQCSTFRYVTAAQLTTLRGLSSTTVDDLIAQCGQPVGPQPVSSTGSASSTAGSGSTGGSVAPGSGSSSGTNAPAGGGGTTDGGGGQTNGGSNGGDGGGGGGSNSGGVAAGVTITLLLVAAAVVGGIYYFRIYRPRQQAMYAISKATSAQGVPPTIMLTGGAEMQPNPAIAAYPAVSAYPVSPYNPNYAQPAAAAPAPTQNVASYPAQSYPQAAPGQAPVDASAPPPASGSYPAQSYGEAAASVPPTAQAAYPSQSYPAPDANVAAPPPQAQAAYPQQAYPAVDPAFANQGAAYPVQNYPAAGYNQV